MVEMKNGEGFADFREAGQGVKEAKGIRSARYADKSLEVFVSVLKESVSFEETA